MMKTKTRCTWTNIVVSINGEKTTYDLSPNGDLKYQFRAKRRNLMEEDIPIQSTELDSNHGSYESICSEEILDSVDLNNFFSENVFDEFDLFTVENSEIEFFDLSDVSEMLI